LVAIGDQYTQLTFLINILSSRFPWFTRYA
jgi:hypothetical protein